MVMVCATESPRVHRPSSTRRLTPSERAARRAAAREQETITLGIVYEPGSETGKADKLCVHRNRRRRCLQCHAARHERFRHRLIWLAQQQLGSELGREAAIATPVYQSVVCWEAWTCAFWPWWDGRQKTMEAVVNDIRCLTWLWRFRADSRINLVRESVKQRGLRGYDRLERRAALRRMIAECANFHVSHQPRLGDGTVAH